jgi:CRP-like cAMP-binding protein
MSWEEEATEHLMKRLVPGATTGGASTLLAAMKRVDVAAGQVVLHEGASDRTLWFVHSGTLEVRAEGRNRDAALATVGSGHWVGEVSLLDGGAASATVAAVEASTLLRLDEPTLLALRRDQPDVALALLRALSQELVDRIRASSKALRGALGDDAPESSWWGSVLGGLFGGDRS